MYLNNKAFIGWKHSKSLQMKIGWDMMQSSLQTSLVFKCRKVHISRCSPACIRKHGERTFQKRKYKKLRQWGFEKPRNRRERNGMQLFFLCGDILDLRSSKIEQQLHSKRTYWKYNSKFEKWQLQLISLKGEEFYHCQWLCLSLSATKTYYLAVTCYG